MPPRLRYLFCQFCVLSLTGFLVFVWELNAQEQPFIAGKIQDSNGVAIPGAAVRLESKDPETAIEVLTDIDGKFRFESLIAHPYKIIVKMEGFQDSTVEVEDPMVPESRNLTIILEPASEESERTAPDAPPSGRARETRGGDARQRGQVFQEVTLADMPGMQQFQDPLAGGIESQGTVNRQDASDFLVISGNAAASIYEGNWNDPSFRNQMMDRVRNMGFDVGMGPGGGGRGGAAGGGGRGGRGGGFPGFGAGRGGRFQQSPVYGSLQSTYSNSALDARPYSLTGQEVAEPLRIRNNFSVSLGGSLPWSAQPSAQGPRGRRFGRRQGTWFFSYSGSRNRNPFNVLTTVPTELERSGDFSQTVLQAGPLAGATIDLYDPQTSNLSIFPEARIPAGRIDPVSRTLLEYIPQPNLPGSVQNYTMQRGLIDTSDNYQGRVNTAISSKDNIFFNYSHRRGNSVSSEIFPGLDTDRTNRAHNIAFGGTHRFQPRLVFNYRFTVNLVKTLRINDFAFEQDIAGELGIRGISDDPINYGIPNVSFTNYGNLRLGNPSLNKNNTYTLGFGFTKIGTTHTIRAGWDIKRNRRSIQGDTNARGTFEFSGFSTSALDEKDRALAGTGYDFADFLLGFPFETSRRFGSSNNSLHNYSFNGFIQDNWRALPNLTIEFGLRYEFIKPYTEERDRIVGLDAAPGFTAVEQVFPGQEGTYSGYFPHSLIFADKNNIGPRLGIAWKPTPSSRWVIRTGYGVFYNPSVYPYIYNQLVGQAPFAVTQNVLTTLSDPLTFQDGFPAEPDVTILNTYAIDPNYRIGYVQQWNFNVQTQIFRAYFVEIGYNGSKGTRLDILRAPNRAPSGSSAGNTEDNRNIDNAGNFVYQDSGANSILHALQINVNRRFSRGFQLRNSYTFSKSIDNASGIGGGNLTVVQDDLNISAERSLSSFDQRHKFSVNFNFELPFGERRRLLSAVSPFLNTIVSGWSMNGNYVLSSGTPLTPRILGNISNNSGTGSNSSERPDVTGLQVSLPSYERTTASSFNTDAFAIPPPGEFGNAGRNTIPGPGTNLLNVSLRKSFRLGENNRRLDFSWRVSNVLNHPNYRGVSTVVNALNFGRVTSVRSMRQMQFNIRINF